MATLQPLGVPTERGIRLTLPVDKLYTSNPYLGIIPRRNSYGRSQSLYNQFTLLQYAQNSPLQLLMDFMDTDPVCSFALWNALRLSFPDDGIVFQAVETESPDDSSEVNEEGTKAIEDFFEQLPCDIGGLNGMCCTLMIQALCTGLVCVEAVPGKGTDGLKRIWPVDSLSIYFGRVQTNDDLTPYQLQYGYSTGYKPLDTNTFFWRAIDAAVDQPEGRAPYAPAVVEILVKLAMMKDLRDAMHQVAYPRLKIGFNFEATFKIASEILQMRDPQEAAAFVQAQFETYVKYAESLKTDDVIVSDTNGTSDILEGGKGLGNIAELMVYLRHDVVMSLKTLPTLLGINDGSTQTYTTAEWRIYAEGIESIRAVVIDVIRKCLNLHLRLKGLPFKAIAKFEKIRTSDSQIEAATAAMEIQNEITKVNQGWITNDQASMKITGSEAEGEPMQVMEPVEPGDVEDKPKQETEQGKEGVDSKEQASKQAKLKARLAGSWQTRRAQYEEVGANV